MIVITGIGGNSVTKERSMALKKVAGVFPAVDDGSVFGSVLKARLG